MVGITTALGFFISLHSSSYQPLYFEDLLTIFTFLLIGTSLTGAGSAVLNHYLERDIDGLMSRTKGRAIVTGALSPVEALIGGNILIISGTAILAWQVNHLTAFLALLTAFLYVLVYTPLKRVTWLNTSVGAIPGAIPPLGGWAAATGDLELGAWLLFVVMFIWQHPHFYAIAWLYKDDYKRANLKMLPVVDQSGERTFLQILIYLIILVVAGCLPYFFGMAGAGYILASLILGGLFLAAGCLFYCSRERSSAKLLVHASILYLPLWFVVLLADICYWKIHI